jgi:hypothetical protein
MLRRPDGSHAAVAMSWTDSGDTLGRPAPPRGGDLPQGDLQGLRPLLHLCDHLRHDGRVPPSRRRTRRASAPQRTLRSHTCTCSAWRSSVMATLSVSLRPLCASAQVWGQRDTARRQPTIAVVAHRTGLATSSRRRPRLCHRRKMMPMPLSSTQRRNEPLTRPALVDVRPSRLRQVRDNTASTTRQYHLAHRAHDLGWPAALVGVLDQAQGRSGASRRGRDGFAYLLAAVGLGRAGAGLC